MIKSREQEISWDGFFKEDIHMRFSANDYVQSKKSIIISLVTCAPALR